MKRLKLIATKILRFPVEETGVVPLTLLFITIVVMSLMMRHYYYHF